METDNKNVNPNQKPEPQKEEKKKNKIVAWWLGLNKWARVGICAGGVGAVALAITLPLCLTKCGGNGGDGGTYNTSFVGDEYKSDVINVKRNYSYTFTCAVNTKPIDTFGIKIEGEGQASYVHIKSPKITGVQNNWSLTDGMQIGGDQITNGTISITVTATENVSNVRGVFSCLRQ